MGQSPAQPPGADRKCQPGSEHTKAVLFDVIAKTAPDGIIIADDEGCILCFSNASEMMFGYAEAEVIGKNLLMLMPANHAEQHDGHMRRYLDTGEKRIIGQGRNVVAMRKDGSVFPAHLEIGELDVDAEHLFIGFIHDRTAEVEATDKSRRLERLLERTGREQMVGEMSSALAHELNQPLSAITNFAKAAEIVLAKDDADLIKAQFYLQRVVEQSLRSGEIVKRMRNLVERGQAKLEPDDINSIVEEAVHVSETGIHDTSIEVHLDLGDDLPKVLADRIQIQQVIVNLLRNAREALEDAEGSGGAFGQEIATELIKSPDRIEMKAKLGEDEHVVVTISDTGPGVNPDMLSAIFDPLVTTKPNGFGVGLAVCRSIIRAHGGHIWAENNAAGGADIHFTLRTIES